MVGFTLNGAAVSVDAPGDASLLHVLRGPLGLSGPRFCCGAEQCGWCLPGILVSAAALLAADPDPDDGTIRRALDPHLCRCGSHNRILRAVKRAARAMREGAPA